MLARRAQTQYAVSLRKIARQVGHLIAGFNLAEPSSVATIQALLSKYAVVLEPWAAATAGRMLADVNQRDQAAWLKHAKEMSAGMRQTIRSTPTGALFRELMAEQVTLIKSLPLEAAQRVHELTIAGLEDSTRAKEIAAEIGRSGKVTASRATLIARTEVARTASKLTEARAQHVGSVAYVWRTAGDGDVRKSHKEMAGKVVRWDAPPTLSDGTKTHAGQIFNCRCYPEPILPADN